MKNSHATPPAWLASTLRTITAPGAGQHAADAVMTATPRHLGEIARRAALLRRAGQPVQRRPR